MEKLAVTCESAAIMLAVPTSQVYRLVKQGKLQATGKGRGVRVLVASIEAHKAPPPPHVPQPLVFQPAGNKIKGFVYLVQLGAYHKIGIAKDVRARVSSLQTGHPDPITLIHTIPTNDMRRAEALLHEQFAAQRARGEWFRLEAEHVATIREYTSLTF